MLEPLKNSIPILEEEEEGYFEVYKDAKDKIIKKIWHQNYNKNMANPILTQFQDKKKAESAFISLADDKEQVKGVVMEIKNLSKVGFGGKETEVVRLVMETENGIKNFDKGTKKWVDELVAKDVDVDSEITIIRHGKKDSKDTWYEIEKHK